MNPRHVRLSKMVRCELDRIPGDRVVVAAVMTVSMADLDAYADLGLCVRDGRIRAGDPVLPPPSLGLHARRNLDGWDDKRTDLPKERRTVSSWVPSWNSGSYHLACREIDAYPRRSSRRCPWQQRRRA